MDFTKTTPWLLAHKTHSDILACGEFSFGQLIIPDILVFAFGEFSFGPDIIISLLPLWVFGPHCKRFRAACFQVSPDYQY